MWVSRVVAVVIAVGYVVAAVARWGVSKWTLLLGVSLLVPLALIWFPRQIGSATGYSVNRQRIDQPTPPILISLAGWFFLVGLPLILYLSWRR
jgi:hypothetical protein